uniref:Uncharacterized protein n=1 Tax=Ciona intestinalis TaxID=7719 RepID=F6U2L4_CIOIN
MNKSALLLLLVIGLLVLTETTNAAGKWRAYMQNQMEDIAQDHLIEMLRDHLDSEQAKLD